MISFDFKTSWKMFIQTGVVCNRYKLYEHGNVIFNYTVDSMTEWQRQTS